MATINSNKIMVESEEPSHEIDVTEQPIEDGIDIMDHVRAKAKTMRISGFIVGDDSNEVAQIRQNILNLHQAGSIVEYTGRNYFVGIITSFQSTHNHQVANGLSFNATLKEVRVAKSSYLKTLPPFIQAQAAPVITVGRKEPVKKEKGQEESVFVDSTGKYH
ncbi:MULTISPECIES: phage baseplate protein [unclassified Paenibacillus]|uniref:phage baseplate protein n=1 Tax=unclassified Paenibacillus TaxID=185978 RepID=UPI00363E678C